MVSNSMSIHSTGTSIVKETHGQVSYSHEGQLGQEMQESIQVNMCNMPHRQSQELFGMVEKIIFSGDIK